MAASGIRILSRVEYEGTFNSLIVAVSLAVGAIPAVQPDVFAQFPTWFSTIFHSGISASAIAAVVLNLIFNELVPRKTSV